MQTYPLSSKLPHVGTTIFTVMSALAQEHQAINLSQGFPDFSCDKKLISLVNHYMKKGHNQYAPMAGAPVLRQRISTLVKELYGADYDPETEITITSGATEALFCAVTALVKEGDEVIVIEPAYDSYIPAIELSGGVPVCIPLEYPSYRLDWDKLKRLINQRTRVIMINTPHNPTGAVLSEQDMVELERLVHTNNIFVISDEVYEHIVFDGLQHASIARFPDLAVKSIIVSSFGKSLHTTGWKVGYALAPPRLTKELRKVHQFVTFSTSTPFQYAIADYLQQQREAIDGLRAFYQAKRDYFLRLMEGSAFTPIPASGTYFQLMSYAGISDEGDEAFAQRLTREYKVASIPVSVFYRYKTDHKVVRFCFAKNEQTLKEAAERLQQVKA
ncbi:MAG: aminotransferase class I/II-fold pyridoxal phosphate-dependent enzyme [Bacteroidetes bacterium]|nr:MAG: aminotransferase class I/II-fold pyridoxal phosphate-dependent enzyme [Bacteroidota bacterium]